MSGKGRQLILIFLSSIFGSLFLQGITRPICTVRAYATHARFNSKLKTYSSTQLGITFQYPATWIQNGEETNAIVKNGKIMSTMVNFTDTLAHSFFFIEYHPAPFGTPFFRDVQSEMRFSHPGGKKIKATQVAGMKAIESSYIMSSDIKGNIYDPALKITQILFKDKRGGVFMLQFKTPLPGADKEFEQFKKLLLSFKFLR